MPRSSATAPKRAAARRAFSYVEAVISTVILGTAVAAGMSLYGSFARGALMDAQRGDAMALCNELMTEILARPFEEPGRAPGSFGKETGELSRSTFDDVDDYHGLNEGPPQAFDGSFLDVERYRGFRRRVEVFNVAESDLTTVRTDGSTAAKLIRVYVVKNKRTLAELVAVRARYTDD